MKVFMCVSGRANPGVGSRQHAFRRAFTLVELLVVIAIIGVLVALLVPSIQTAREAARRTACLNNLKQVALGLQIHHDANKRFPPAFKAPDTYESGTTANGTYGQGISWVAYLLPFIEQSDLYNRVNFAIENQTNNADPNSTLAQQIRPNALLCPSLADAADALGGANASTAGAYCMHYYGVMGVVIPSSLSATYPGYTVDGGAGNDLPGQGMFPVSVWKKPRGRAAKDVTDGLSKTYLLGESSWARISADGRSHTASYLAGYNNAAGWYIRSARNIFYARPINVARYLAATGIQATSANIGWNNLNWGSNHPRGTHFARVDGSVDFVEETVDMTVLMAGGSVNGGE